MQMDTNDKRLMVTNLKEEKKKKEKKKNINPIPKAGFSTCSR